MAESDDAGRLAGALAAAAVVLVMLALVLSYAGRALLRPEPFADRAVAALRDPAVQDLVADHLTSAVVQAGNGDLVTLRPVVRSLAGTIVGSRAFAALLHRAVLNAHTAVVQGNSGAILLNVADASVLVQAALERFSPETAMTVRLERIAALLTLHPGGGLLTIVHAARRVYSAAWILAALAALLAAAALWRSGNRRSTLRQLGIGLAIGGMVVIAIYFVGGAIASQAAPPGRGPVARALWRAFLRGLEVQALIVAAAGAIVAGAASGRLRPIGVDTAVTRGWRLLTDETATPGRRLLASLGPLALGAAILLEPGPALTIAALATGLWLLSKGAEGALAAIAGLRSRSEAGLRRRAARALAYAPAAVAIAAIAAPAAILATGGADEAPAAEPVTCNGFVALCDRPLNDVALAATHNSMASVTIPDWRLGQQDGTIADQLDNGIHGLLIDSYYGEAVRGGVYTDLESLPKREAAVQEIGEPAVDAALRIHDRLRGRGSGRKDIFLCHGFCELGAVTLSSALQDLRSFLVSHPGEVVVVINQDEGVKPTDIESAFQRAGLLDLLYRGPMGPFPTLRQMIDSNQRLVVMAENDAGEIPWYHPAYEQALQETPFRFTRAAQLTEPAKIPASCRPNRGPDTAPLFLVNHWIDTTPLPRASLAEIVNARGPLLARARECERIRNRIPNLVAVDFYKRGDLLGVVNELNGV
jgi:hypothetical protein